MMQDVVAATERTIRNIVGEIHTAMPGKIQNYDQSTGMASVVPCGTYHCEDGRVFPYPVISGVPLVVMASGSISVSVPIRPDMDCLLIISEQSLDQWLQGTQTSADLSYDLTNAIAIPGLSKASILGQIEANHSGSVIISNGAAKIAVSPSDISISGNVNIQGNITCSGSSPWKLKGED